MQAQRGHLDRDNGDIEGVANVLQHNADAHHAAPIPAPPAWLSNWERRRPRLLVEMLAETVGVFFYVFAGVGASTAFLVSVAGGASGYGNLLTIALAYAFGIAFAIIVAAPTSGGHLSPGFTVAFMLFKGFPARKAPFYIIAQLFGAFLATVSVYGQYKQQIDQITAGMRAAGEAAVVFTPQGPAGLFALFPQPGQLMRYAFLNEFMCNIFLAILVFACLDPTNSFVSIAGAPFVIGLGYFVIVSGFAVDSVSLNAGRDLGGRMGCAAIFGSKCFTASPAYTAIACLTTFPATIIGAAIHTLFLSDNRRMLVNYPAEHHDAVSIVNEQRGFSMPTRAITRESQIFRDPSSFAPMKN